MLTASSLRASVFSPAWRWLGLALLALCVLSPPRAALAAEPQREGLRVSANHHYLERRDGTPFFYLGDTAWMLSQRLVREDVDRYLADRASKGFTVIQMVALFSLEKNAYGETPLLGRDPGRPNEAFFQHVDYIVRKAGSLGLFVGMLPSWGNLWKQVDGNAIFTPESAHAFGRFLGQRYRQQPIIWILGGDDNPVQPVEFQILDALAAGLKRGDGGTHLFTYHPRGPGRSSEFLHRAAWLDFNMSQSSHGARDHDNGLFSEADYRLEPKKPSLDGEPRYETIPIGFYWKNVDSFARFDDYDVRQAAYWSLLGGACGHTYGNNNVWQFYAGQGPGQISANQSWVESLDHPGAFQMRFVRRLFESRPYQKLEPRQSMIVDGPAEAGAKVRAARAADGSFAFIYSPRGAPFTIDQSIIAGPKLKKLWYDPRYGIAYWLHTGTTKAMQTYTPPTAGRGCDWILIVEDESQRFPALGATAP